MLVLVLRVLPTLLLTAPTISMTITVGSTSLVIVSMRVIVIVVSVPAVVPWTATHIVVVEVPVGRVLGVDEGGFSDDERPTFSMTLLRIRIRNLVVVRSRVVPLFLLNNVGPCYGGVGARLLILIR